MRFYIHIVGRKNAFQANQSENLPYPRRRVGDREAVAQRFSAGMERKQNGNARCVDATDRG
jgi:hypothetical protein